MRGTCRDGGNLTGDSRPIPMVSTLDAARQVSIPAASAGLAGDLVVPAGARSIVLFAHGSGSSRRSPRNRYVAGVLNESGIATLLFDLLTAREEAVDLTTREHRFDIALLTRRLVAATEGLAGEAGLRELGEGYFGASTGSAASLFAAAHFGPRIGAVVSRGGRPALADAQTLASVVAPTLLIVGGRDDTVIALNQQAYAALRGERELAIVPGATHLFEEPGALETVAALARGWFARYLPGGAGQSRGEHG
jgi:pimeloyl-ACP methyl ester carboxylesterase